MKISFDFDDTLSEGTVQHFAKKCIEAGYEVHITTARPGDNRKWNEDLYYVADKLGIPESRIHFCNLTPKYKYFVGLENFVHLDDDEVEVREINKYTKNKAFHYTGYIDEMWAGLSTMGYGNIKM